MIQVVDELFQLLRIQMEHSSSETFLFETSQKSLEASSHSSTHITSPVHRLHANFRLWLKAVIVFIWFNEAFTVPSPARQLLSLFYLWFPFSRFRVFFRVRTREISRCAGKHTLIIHRSLVLLWFSTLHEMVWSVKTSNVNTAMFGLEMF